MTSPNAVLEVTYLPTTSLKPHPQNPRIHTLKQVRQIARSIKAFGWNVPILIDKRQRVVAGHGRLLAARELGWTTVPVITLNHLSDSQFEAFLIADNRLTENSSWDERLLGEQLKVLSELELNFELEVTGFETAEIDVLIDGLENVNEPDPDDRLPRVETSAVSVEGDLWQLGNPLLFVKILWKDFRFDVEDIHTSVIKERTKGRISAISVVVAGVTILKPVPEALFDRDIEVIARNWTCGYGVIGKGGSVELTGRRWHDVCPGLEENARLAVHGECLRRT